MRGRDRRSESSPEEILQMLQIQHDSILDRLGEIWIEVTTIRSRVENMPAGRSFGPRMYVPPEEKK